MMLSKRRAQTRKCTDRPCLHVTGLLDLLTPLFSHDSSSPNHLYPSFFHTFGSFPKNLISLVTMLRCSFPASHNVSHPYRQWYPPQSVRCSPVDPWCWVSPLAHGSEASLGGDRSDEVPSPALVPLCSCVCAHLWWADGSCDEPGSSQAGWFLGSFTCHGPSAFLSGGAGELLSHTLTQQIPNMGWEENIIQKENTSVEQTC